MTRALIVTLIPPRLLPDTDSRKDDKYDTDDDDLWVECEGERCCRVGEGGCDAKIGYGAVEAGQLFKNVCDYAMNRVGG